MQVPEEICRVYNKSQLTEIRDGLISGVDVSQYSNPKYNERQMHEIRIGLELVLCVDDFAKPEFSAKQMEALRSGLLNGDKISLYADPKYNAKVLMYLGELSHRYDFDEILERNLSENELRQMYEDSLSNKVSGDFGFGGKVDGISYSPEQYYQIQKGKSAGIDTSIYGDSDLSPVQMRVIREGLSDGREFGWVYAQPDITAVRMYNISKVFSEDQYTEYPNPFEGIVDVSSNSKLVDINVLIKGDIESVKGESSNISSSSGKTIEEVLAGMSAANRSMLNK